REVCTVKRVITDTPLQALVLWNDPTYVEASRKMAERVLLTKADASDDDRIAFAFRLATARYPKPAEAAVLKQILATQLHRFQSDSSAAEKLLSVGESPRNQSIETSRLAAWTMVCSTILNLDETLTRG
ncbi:MAG TPA: DUF1553 domain-containing protein, partial [Tepidisphaeraceae bacterium]|nr:DUF1553 domain-containing protein [Tepidisphaeraceae bacterium]